MTTTRKTSAAQRQHLHELMTLLLAHEPQIDYPTNDVRGQADAVTFALTEPLMRAQIGSGGHLMGDCSGIATDLFKWCGLRDPNGLNYTHQGYTGTMLAALPHYQNPANALVGALVVFGPGTGDHVAVVLEPGHDPLLFSHGGEDGPLTIRLSLERTYHRPPVTFLSIAALG